MSYHPQNIQKMIDQNNVVAGGMAYAKVWNLFCSLVSRRLRRLFSLCLYFCQGCCTHNWASYGHRPATPRLSSRGLFLLSYLMVRGAGAGVKRPSVSVSAPPFLSAGGAHNRLVAPRPRLIFFHRRTRAGWWSTRGSTRTRSGWSSCRSQAHPSRRRWACCPRRRRWSTGASARAWSRSSWLGRCVCVRDRERERGGGGGLGHDSMWSNL